MPKIDPYEIDHAEFALRKIVFVSMEGKLVNQKRLAFLSANQNVIAMEYAYL